MELAPKLTPFIKCVRTLMALAVRWITPTLKMLH